ncbi:hypothetical protein [Micromonospora sp. CPCC 206061]|uniref:hypothetical protein n=1 Tax=Micromonospora sp. CPCC 206061 TaxID=3122410 RepID=UPI002FF075AD
MTRTATTYGMQDGFDYEGFQFSDAFPVPDAYAVLYGMAHFQGPDGYLWFAPDNGAGQNSIDWAYPQNVAEFDRRQENDEDAYHRDPEYQAVMAELCAQVDAVSATDARYGRWSRTRIERSGHPATH